MKVDTLFHRGRVFLLFRPPRCLLTLLFLREIRTLFFMWIRTIYMKINPSSFQEERRRDVRCLKTLICLIWFGLTWSRSFKQICNFNLRTKCVETISREICFIFYNYSIIITIISWQMLYVKIFMWTPKETKPKQRFVSFASWQRVNVIFWWIKWFREYMRNLPWLSLVQNFYLTEGIIFFLRFNEKL